MDASFRDSGVKGPLWGEVSRKLTEQGYNRSGKKCKEKFENIHKYYKKSKDGRAGRADGGELSVLCAAGCAVRRAADDDASGVAADNSSGGQQTTTQTLTALPSSLPCTHSCPSSPTSRLFFYAQPELLVRKAALLRPLPLPNAVCSCEARLQEKWRCTEGGGAAL
jgi:hypothetical protein